eukprot:jgi/Botrbrau1/10707/Bobra.357_1s0009.1
MTPSEKTFFEASEKGSHSGLVSFPKRQTDVIANKGCDEMSKGEKRKKVTMMLTSAAIMLAVSWLQSRQR